MEPYRERIEDFLRRWRSRYEGDRVFRVLVITVVLAAMGVTLSGLQQTPTYEASAQVWVDQKQGDQQTNLAGTVEGLQELTLAMALAIDNRPVAEEVIQRLELEMTPAELLDSLTIEQVESTSFIVLTYEDTDPVRATRIVNTLGEVSSELISERSAAGSQLTAKVYEEAVVPESPVSPHPLRNGLLTLVIGLALCAETVVIRPGVGQGQAGVLSRWHRDASIVERTKEQELLRALGRRGKLTALEASLATSLTVEEAERMLSEFAYQGQLEVTVEHGRLLYSFWGEHGA